MSEDFNDMLPDLALTFMGIVNELLATVAVPDDMRQRLEAAREELAIEHAAEDAGIHSGIWRGCYLDADGTLRDADRVARDPHWLAP